MRRGVAVALALVLAASAACSSITQEALVVDPSVPKSITSAPEASVKPTDPVDETTFKATALAKYDGGPLVTIPNVDGKDEAAIHALAPTPDGWVAVGSITTIPNPGWAAVWRVGNDGAFGDAEVLPSAAGLEPSFARDVMTFGAETVAVGRTGAGTDAVATAWLLHADGTRMAVALPSDPVIRGTTADVALRLDDGTIVVVGRADGPFFSRLILWWSTDGGQTWSSLTPPTPAYLEPHAATDGTRVVVLARTIHGPDGMVIYRSVVFVHDADGLVFQAQEEIQPTPGRPYWPSDLVWDGAAFVAGLDTDQQQVLATSVDGLTYTVADMNLPGLAKEPPSVIAGLVVVDGAVEVFIKQEDSLFAFRKDAGDTWLPLAIPSVTAGEMQFLIAHEPLATDGHRVAYLVERWYSRALLIWDGTTWSRTYLPKVPAHRNDTRLDVRDIASAGGSDLALLDHSEETAKGNLHATPAGLLWRANGLDHWDQLDIEGKIDQPLLVSAWDKLFLVADYDFTGGTRVWRFDPALGDFSRMGALPGRALSLVAANDGLYALSAGAVWMSPDGEQWSQVPLPAEAVALCSDGARAVAVWAKPQDARDEYGVETLRLGVATTVGVPLTTKNYEIVEDERATVKCALNGAFVVESHHGYDDILGEDVPVGRVVPLYGGIRENQVLLHQFMGRGADESWIEDIAADANGWVAVGTARDTEISMDAVLWRSADGFSWEKAETIAGGPGNQIAWTVTIRDGEILVGGLDGQRATIWRLPRANCLNDLVSASCG